MYRTPNRCRLIAGLIALIVSPLSVSMELTGTVKAVEDGDTVSFLDTYKGYYRVDIRGIDAPERAQPYGRRAKAYLSRLVLNKPCKIVVAEDRFNVNRAYDADLYVQDAADHWQNIAQAMLSTGHAWIAKDWPKHDPLVGIAARAQQQQQGLWSLPAFQIVEPSEWIRKARRDPAYPQSLKIDPRTDCGKKTRCVQMGSCSEARFFMQRCRVQTLDSDQDGIPCPELCRG